MTIHDTIALQKSTSFQRDIRPDGSVITYDGPTISHEGTVVEQRKFSIVTSNYALLKLRKDVLPENDFLRSSRSRSGEIRSVEVRPANSDEIHRVRPVLRYPGAWFSDEPWPDFTNLELKLLNDVKGQTWNAPQTVLESRKTLDLAVAGMTRLGAGMHALKKGHFGEFLSIFGMSSKRTERQFNHAYGRDPSRAAATAWVEGRYGWMPTIYDIHDAASTLAELINTEGGNLASVSVRETNNLNNSFRYEMETDPVLPVTVSSRGSRQLRIKVWYKKDVGLAAPKALGLTDPGLFYEVFPLSFVADWFIPIGDYLSAFNATQGLTFEKGSYSVRKIKETEVVGVSSDNFLCSGSFHYDYQASERRRMVGFPNPRFPKFSLDLNLKRFVDGLALTRLIFGGK